MTSQRFRSRTGKIQVSSLQGLLNELRIGMPRSRANRGITLYGICLIQRLRCLLQVANTMSAPERQVSYLNLMPRFRAHVTWKAALHSESLHVMQAPRGSLQMKQVSLNLDSGMCSTSIASDPSGTRKNASGSHIAQRRCTHRASVVLLSTPPD